MPATIQIATEAENQGKVSQPDGKALCLKLTLNYVTEHRSAADASLEVSPYKFMVRYQKVLRMLQRRKRNHL